jgi:sec-independent protein translocase protein TatB
MKTEFEDAARNVEQTVNQEVNSATAALQQPWNEAASAYDGSNAIGAPHEALMTPAPSYRPPKKNWRLKRGAMPQWYKQRHGVKAKAQSGAARVARFRPPGIGPRS